MKRAVYACLWIFLVSTLTCALPRLSSKKSQQNEPVQQSKTTIEGLVRDIACPIQNPAATATKFNMKCALDCAKQGSPLIILTNDGEMYFPISDSMPDIDQRQKLIPFVGKYVRITGTVFERKGTRAIAIGSIKEMKSVHLITNAE